MWKRWTTTTCAGVLLILCISIAPAAGNTIVVTNTFDVGSGSLRTAITNAAPGDTIELDVSGTIALTAGPLVIRKNLSIVGPGAASLMLRGDGSSRVFAIETATVSISGVAISGGVADYGGGILNSGRLTLTDCVLSSNAATMFGGAIFNSGTLRLVRSVVTTNVAEYRAGAIHSETGSTLTIDHSTLSDNSSSSEAGWFQLVPSPYAALVRPPIAADGSSVFRGGRGVVPVKFSLTYQGVTTCDAGPATIALFQQAGTLVGPVTLNAYTLPADNGEYFRIDTTACQYVYNVSTASLAPGTYRVTMLIDSVAVRSATFGIQ